MAGLFAAFAIDPCGRCRSFIAPMTSLLLGMDVIGEAVSLLHA